MLILWQKFRAKKSQLLPIAWQFFRWGRGLARSFCREWRVLAINTFKLSLFCLITFPNYIYVYLENDSAWRRLWRYALMRFRRCWWNISEDAHEDVPEIATDDGTENMFVKRVRRHLVRSLWWFSEDVFEVVCNDVFLSKHILWH